MIFSEFGSSLLWGFVLTSILIELTPGPNMIYLAILSVSEGRFAGYAATFGVALGLALVGILSALGMAALISSSPVLYHLLRFGGTFYLLWLAYEGWVEAPMNPAWQNGGGRIDYSKYFRRGLLTNLLNPKAALFYVAVLPGFVESGAEGVQPLLVLSLLYVLVASLIHGGIVTLAGSAQAFLKNQKQMTFVRRVLAVALAFVALWFAWATHL